MDHDPTRSVSSADDPRASPTDPGAPGLEPGQKVAERYRVTAVLGSGGMGAVYAAWDERLGREVALKVVRPQLSAHPTVLARFEREARALAGVRHPGLVAIYDVGATGPNGAPYLVMEKLTGETLAARLRRGPLSPQEAVGLTLRVLDAVQAAHAVGTIHRDLKPANIFLCEPDGSPRVLDLGIASVAATSEDDPRLTATGAGMGTPLYTAPEQLRGEPPDVRMDVYALGATLYEALSGRAIFSAKTLPELCSLKLTTTPAPLATVAPSVPTALSAAVERALATDPRARFESAGAFAAALSAALSQPEEVALAATLATPPSLASPTSASAPTSQLPVSSTGPVPPRSTGALALTTPATPPGVEAPRVSAPSPGPVRWARWALAASLALLAVGGLWRATLPPPAPNTRTSTGVAHVEVPSPRAPVAGLRQLALFHDSAGGARASLASPEGWQVAEADFAGAEGQPGAPARWRAARAFCQGRARLLEGDLPAATAAMSRAVSLDPAWASARVGLANAHATAGRTEAALAETREAERLEPTWWLPIHVRAGVYAGAGRLTEAVQEYQRARRLVPAEPVVLDGLALALHGLGIDDQATQFAREALALDPNAVWGHLVLAESALEARRGEEALREADLAVVNGPRIAAAHLARGDALALVGRREAALEAWRTALSLAGQMRSPGMPEGRLAEVREALARAALPRPRGQAVVGSRTVAPSRRRTPGRQRTVAPEQNSVSELGL